MVFQLPMGFDFSCSRSKDAETAPNACASERQITHKPHLSQLLQNDISFIRKGREGQSNCFCNFRQQIQSLSQKRTMHTKLAACLLCVLGSVASFYFPHQRALMFNTIVVALHATVLLFHLVTREHFILSSFVPTRLY